MFEVPPAVATPVTVPQTPAHARRLDFIDALRGLIICLMVLDHVRDFTHHDAFLFDPLDLDKTSVWLYFTRWVTHLCAPTFVLLSGISIYLQARKGKTGWALSRFLLTRGLWLIVLELTLVNWGFDFLLTSIFLQVIWAIGFSMILMAGMVWAAAPGGAGHRRAGGRRPQPFRHGRCAGLWRVGCPVAFDDATRAAARRQRFHCLSRPCRGSASCVAAMVWRRCMPIRTRTNAHATSSFWRQG